MGESPRCNCPDYPYWSWSPTRTDVLADGTMQHSSYGSWYWGGGYRPAGDRCYCFACNCRLEADGTVVPMIPKEETD